MHAQPALFHQIAFDRKSLYFAFTSLNRRLKLVAGTVFRLMHIISSYLLQLSSYGSSNPNLASMNVLPISPLQAFPAPPHTFSLNANTMRMYI